MHSAIIIIAKIKNQVFISVCKNYPLDKFEKFTKDPTLEAMEYIMAKFGNPHKKVKIVHVAGTNGKGSTCAMIAKALQYNGFKVLVKEIKYVIRRYFSIS